MPEDVRTLLFHFISKVSSFQIGFEAATDKDHIQESQKDSIKKKKQYCDEKEMNTYPV
jgi:hypothetical protein